MLVTPLDLLESQLQALFARLQHLHGAMYLDSASKEHSNSNFSVFAWDPVFTIEADLVKTQVFDQHGKVEQTQDDPFIVIQKYLDKAQLKESQLPFSGGAIGYFDYELGGRFETLPTAKATDISLPNMFVGIFDTAIVIEQKTQTAYFVSQHPEAQSRLTEVLALQQATLPDFTLSKNWQANMTKEEYASKFAQVQEYLLSGDCYQINLAQRFSAEYQGSEWQAYQKLRANNQAPFSSFIRYHQSAVLSVSPERFLQVNGNQIETKPIKGTRPRSSDPIKDQMLADELRSADKDRAENLMIVDLLRNDVSKVAQPGSVEVPSLFAIESFPSVHHLVSTVTAKLAETFSSLDLLRGAFPGGSITGAPKIRAMEIIHQLEPHPRSVYCGAIGYIKPNGDMDTNITIRTLVCDQGKIHCWAGGGLVADSDCDSEYQETLDKLSKILPVLAE